MLAHPTLMRQKFTWNGVEHVIEPRQGRRPRHANRILEIHGLMGAIGEQLGLGWTAEQDVQRLDMTTGQRGDDLVDRLAIRAQSELVGHFVLGAVHSMANLVLRVLLLDAAAAEVLDQKYNAAQGFPPGSDGRDAWPTFGLEMAKQLRRAAKASGSGSMVQLAGSISELRTDSAYAALDGRRGMDYHRRRPQSIPHTAPREGTVTTTGTTTTLTMVGARLEDEANPKVVHSVASSALVRLAKSMREIREAIPTAVRDQGITYPFDFVSS